MKKILITGSKGFIGFNLYNFLKYKYNVDCWHRAKVDLLDTEKVKNLLKKNKYDIVIHAATYDAATNFSVNNKDYVYPANMKMFENLILNSHTFGKMFYFGSGSEYDKNNNSEYAKSKRHMNLIINKSLTNVYNLRLYCVYGPYANWRYRIVNNMCCKATTPYPIVIPENRIVDFLHINDLVRIIELLFNKQYLFFKDYDICSGELISYKNVAEIVKSLCDNNIVYSDKYEKKDYFGNNKRLINEIGKSFRFTPIEVGIMNLIQFYNFQPWMKKDLELFEY